MTTVGEVWNLLEECHDLPVGPEQVQACERAVGLADLTGDLCMQVDARLALSEAYVFGDPGPHFYPVISWLLTTLDEASDTIGPARRESIHWHLKWAVHTMLYTPDISREVLLRTHQDVEERFRAEGNGRHAIAMAHASVAYYLGGDEELAAAVARYRTVPRDAMSDCEVCCARIDARMSARLGDIRAAAAQADQVIERGLSCGTEPEGIQSDALDWFMRLGRSEAAVTAHVGAWRAIRSLPAYADEVALHLAFLIRSGHAGRAWSLLEPRLHWTEEIRLPYTLMTFQAAVAMVMTAAHQDGAIPQQRWVDSLSAVAAHARAESLRLAAVFDARNGTTRVSDDLAALVDPTPYDVPLELPTDVARGCSANPARHHPVGRSAPNDPEPTDGPLMLSPEDGILAWHAAVRSAVMSFDRRAEQIVSRWRDLRREFPTPSTPQEWAAAAYLDRRVVPGNDSERSRPRGPSAETETIATRRPWLERALDEAEQGDDLGLTRRIRVELAILEAQEKDGDYAPAIALAEAIPDDDPAKAAAFTALGEHPDPRTGAMWCERAAQVYASRGESDWQGMSLARAAWHFVSIDPAEAERTARVASSLFEKAGVPAHVLDLSNTALGLALSLQGDDESAVQHLSSVVRKAHSRGETPPLPASMELCECLISLSMWSDLLVAARHAVADVAGAGPVAVASARRFLGVALLETGRSAEAASVLEEALPILREAQSPTLGPAACTLAEALRRLEDLAGAIGVYRIGARSFERSGREGEAARCLIMAADLTWESGDPRGALPDYESAARLADRYGDLSTYLDARRGRAAAMAQDDLAAGMEALLSCEQEIAELSDEPRFDGAGYESKTLRLSLLLQGSRLGRDRGDADTALSCAIGATQLATGARLTGAAAEARSLQGQALLMRGRTEHAEQLLREVLPVLSRESAPPARIEAARSLAILLDDAGRGQEAEEVWETFGPYS